MKFKGTIVITDPCYIIRRDQDDDWDKCSYGSNMEVLGIKTYITRDTEYGDWSCTTLDSLTKEHIGSFCADAGLVSVFLLDEILTYNPNYDYKKEQNFCATIIESFEGDVEITHREYVYEDEETGEKIDEREVSVLGRGNKNFFTTQTGF